eukprot:11021311-Prorocentrum_lima.AAC.1
MCIRDRYVGGLERTVDAIKDELMKWASVPLVAADASSNPFGEEAFKFEAVSYTHLRAHETRRHL